MDVIEQRKQWRKSVDRRNVIDFKVVSLFNTVKSDRLLKRTSLGDRQNHGKIRDKCRIWLLKTSLGTFTVGGEANA